MRAMASSNLPRDGLNGHQENLNFEDVTGFIPSSYEIMLYSPIFFWVHCTWFFAARYVCGTPGWRRFRGAFPSAGAVRFVFPSRWCVQGRQRSRPQDPELRSGQSPTPTIGCPWDEFSWDMSGVGSEAWICFCKDLSWLVTGETGATHLLPSAEF